MPLTLVNSGDVGGLTLINQNNLGKFTLQGRGVPYQQLNTIASYLRNYMSEFRNPSFYTYRLDGNGFQILDGGLDMYDNGNITSPAIRAGNIYTSSAGYSAAVYPSASNYTQTGSAAILDGDFNYISLGYIQYGVTQSATFHPLTVIGSRENPGPVGWQVGGNSGADGGGLLATGSIYTGSIVNGFTVHAFYRQTYNATDPSHCTVIMLLGHPNWNSTFGTIISGSDVVRLGGCGVRLLATGSNTSNILAVNTLLSKNSGIQVTAAECKTVVDNFVTRIQQSVGF
jgi:hypothetical protein